MSMQRSRREAAIRVPLYDGEGHVIGWGVRSGTHWHDVSLVRLADRFAVRDGRKRIEDKGVTERFEQLHACELLDLNRRAN